MQLLVVGAGAMGRWFADTVGRGAPGEVDVAFADTSAAAAADAAARYDARQVAVDGDERFDAVCLAVPISAVQATVDAQAARAREAMVDVTGAMGPPVAAMRAALPTNERVSFHPLFAPANAPGTVAVVVDQAGPVTDRLRAALAAADCDLFETTVDEHDRAMETVQASAHAAVLAYALAAREVRPEFHTPVSGALAEVVETVTGGTPRVYREIQETFEGADRVAEAAARVASADGEAFESLYREASDRVLRGAHAERGDGDDSRGGGDHEDESSDD
ncbi:prephenate dehydrogenase/arogenate dehydrogenase family protein [Salinigranum salinum]|uniref:prephenate dehydrogenase/arogenate dehydrogenase family protein n=1 Tax=Salinigranum salinum TaxID=1364937 RepID=UPI0012612A10|nr:prephenate dehydrogenase/arogenate dehydrogenase family protein [Salinigranum salinum]